MDAKEQIFTIRIEGYGKQRIDGSTTVALINGDANFVFIRTGSDAFKLPSGQCLPIYNNSVYIVNPFPRQIEICIGIGTPARYAAEGGFTPQQSLVSNSYHYGYRDIPNPVTGKRFAIGVMMKRGEALMYFSDQNSNLNSKVMLFPGASPEFMSFKPAGCMMDTIEFRGSDGVIDDSAYTVGGYYDDAQVGAWIAAARYVMTPIVVRHQYIFQTLSAYRTAQDVAVFYIREPDTGAHFYARLQHLGTYLEDLD